MNEKERLLKVIDEQPEAQQGGAVVTIDEFFTGNVDLGSIGCNLIDHPGLPFFRQRLKEMEARDDVAAVWFEIYESDELDWPFSENVIIQGTITEAEVRKLTEKLEPSEIWLREIKSPHSRDSRLVGSVWNLWWD
ncbi:MAG: hypothetical protein JNK76_07395 [Planctomycetales bacterium]|nr:hypothetical protein [Planctomycetales bacterium]MBN8624675.1 hypothetical protein [Planctomycetota bacterium]